MAILESGVCGDQHCGKLASLRQVIAAPFSLFYPVSQSHDAQARCCAAKLPLRSRLSLSDAGYFSDCLLHLLLYAGIISKNRISLESIKKLHYINFGAIGSEIKMDVLQRNNVLQQGNSADPVILYAHGFGCNQTMWSRITPAFSSTHRQVLFDYVGCGQSDRTSFDDQRYSSLQGYAQDLLDVCDALGLESNVTFVGHSVSCSVGLLASIIRPHLFERMVLIGPSPCFVNHPPDYFGGFEPEDLIDLLELLDQNYIGWAHYLAPIVAGETSTGKVAGELSDSFCSTDPQVTRVFAKTTFFPTAGPTCRRSRGHAWSCNTARMRWSR
ncbi:MAG: sigma-B regulation protein RsbQ [Janthinobacterium sp.]